jgi:hypothetical protein
MGGSKRDDNPFAIAVLCAQHHTGGRDSAHGTAYAGAAQKEIIHRKAMLRRPVFIWNRLFAFMEEYDLPVDEASNQLLRLAGQYGEVP